MRAYIKEDKWEKFKEICNSYKFHLVYKPHRYYTKVIDCDLLLIVNKKTREMNLITPMGGSPFMEVHIDMYKDLYDDGYVEFVEGKFD